jgi:hypothetical protein
LSNDDYPLLNGVPPSDDDGDVDEDQGEADEQRLQVAVHGSVDSVVVTLFAKKKSLVIILWTLLNWISLEPRKLITLTQMIMFFG